MLKSGGSIKEIEAYLLREILISKDTLQGQKNCCEPPERDTVMGNLPCNYEDIKMKFSKESKP